MKSNFNYDVLSDIIFSFESFKAYTLLRSVALFTAVHMKPLSTEHNFYGVFQSKIVVFLLTSDLENYHMYSPMVVIVIV